MMKKEYTIPEMEILKFETEDCITTSTQQQQEDLFDYNDIPGAS